MLLPSYLVEESAVRESGESPVISLGESADNNLSITLGITHAMEQESIDLDILTSDDGREWSSQPALSFTRKSFCGTYQLTLPAASGKFVKAAWRVRRWGQAGSPPFFRFYLYAESGRARTMSGAA